jgi:hypothetical protein
MLPLDINYKGFNKLSELEKRLILPLQTAAANLAARIRDRVLRGVGPSGQNWKRLGTYTTTGRSQDPDNKWWVGPGLPQPAGYVDKIEGGKWQGWAIYENYERYLELMPNGHRRDWNKSGRLWQSLGIRAMAVNKVKVSFYGSRQKGVAQAQVAYLAGRKEDASVLMYSAEEGQAFVDEIKASMDQEFARRLGQAVELGRINSRLAGARRRSSRLLGG